MSTDMHSREYIDGLVQHLVQNGYTKDAETAISMSKALARMFISANEYIDSIRKYPGRDIPSEFYNLVEALYYSILRERDNRG